MVWAHRISITLPIMERVRWGIIGVGNVTEGKSGPAFSKLNDPNWLPSCAEMAISPPTTLGDTTSALVRRCRRVDQRSGGRRRLRRNPT